VVNKFASDISSIEARGDKMKIKYICAGMLLGAALGVVGYAVLLISWGWTL